MAKLTPEPNPDEPDRYRVPHSGPFLYFLSTNLWCGLLGFLQMIVVTRMCGAVELGVAAALGSVAPLLLNLLDFRVGDLVLSRINELPDLNARRKLVRAAFLAQTGTAALAWVFASALLYIIHPWILDGGKDGGAAGYLTLAIVIAPGGVILGFQNGFISTLQRVLMPGPQLNRVLLVNAVGGFVISTGCVLILPSALGILLGIMLTALCGTAINLSSLRTYLPGVFNPRITGEDVKELQLAIRSNRKLLVAGNLFGYAKAFHRGADVLLVSFFCAPVVVGWYKFARSLTDNFSIISDALQKRFAPQLLNWASIAHNLARDNEVRARMASQFAEFASRSTALGIVLGGALVALEYRYLESAIGLVFDASFTPAAPAVIVFTFSAVLTTAVGTWIWQLVLGAREMMLYTKSAFIATTAGQYIGSYLCLSFLAANNPLALTAESNALMSFAIGHVLVYPLQYGMFLAVFYRYSATRASAGNPQPPNAFADTAQEPPLK